MLQHLQKPLECKKKGFLIIGFIDKDSKFAKQIETKKKKSKFYGEETLYSSAQIIEYAKLKTDKK